MLSIQFWSEFCSRIDSMVTHLNGLLCKSEIIFDRKLVYRLFFGDFLLESNRLRDDWRRASAGDVSLEDSTQLNALCSRCERKTSESSRFQCTAEWGQSLDFGSVSTLKYSNVYSSAKHCKHHSVAVLRMVIAIRFTFIIAYEMSYQLWNAWLRCLRTESSN